MIALWILSIGLVGQISAVLQIKSITCANTVASTDKTTATLAEICGTAKLSIGADNNDLGVITVQELTFLLSSFGPLVSAKDLAGNPPHVTKVGTKAITDQTPNLQALPINDQSLTFPTECGVFFFISVLKVVGSTGESFSFDSLPIKRSCPDELNTAFDLALRVVESGPTQEITPVNGLNTKVTGLKVLVENTGSVKLVARTLLDAFSIVPMFFCQPTLYNTGYEEALNESSQGFSDKVLSEMYSDFLIDRGEPLSGLETAFIDVTGQKGKELNPGSSFELDLTKLMFPENGFQCYDTSLLILFLAPNLNDAKDTNNKLILRLDYKSSLLGHPVKPRCELVPDYSKDGLHAVILRDPYMSAVQVNGKTKQFQMLEPWDTEKVKIPRFYVIESAKRLSSLKLCSQPPLDDSLPQALNSSFMKQVFNINAKMREDLKLLQTKGEVEKQYTESLLMMLDVQHEVLKGILDVNNEGFRQFILKTSFIGQKMKPSGGGPWEDKWSGHKDESGRANGGFMPSLFGMGGDSSRNEFGSHGGENIWTNFPGKPVIFSEQKADMHQFPGSYGGPGMYGSGSMPPFPGFPPIPGMFGMPFPFFTPSKPEGTGDWRPSFFPPFGFNDLDRPSYGSDWGSSRPSYGPGWGVYDRPYGSGGDSSGSPPFGWDWGSKDPNKTMGGSDDPRMGNDQGTPGFGINVGTDGDTDDDPGMGGTDDDPGMGGTDDDPGMGGTDDDPGMGGTDNDPGMDGDTDDDPGTDGDDNRGIDFNNNNNNGNRMAGGNMGNRNTTNGRNNMGNGNRNNMGNDNGNNNEDENDEDSGNDGGTGDSENSNDAAMGTNDDSDDASSDGSAGRKKRSSSRNNNNGDRNRARRSVALEHHSGNGTVGRHYGNDGIRKTSNTLNDPHNHESEWAVKPMSRETVGNELETFPDLLDGISKEIGSIGDNDLPLPGRPPKQRPPDYDQSGSESEGKKKYSHTRKSHRRNKKKMGKCSGLSEEDKAILEINLQIFLSISMGKSAEEITAEFDFLYRPYVEQLVKAIQTMKSNETSKPNFMEPWNEFIKHDAENEGTIYMAFYELLNRIAMGFGSMPRGEDELETSIGEFVTFLKNNVSSKAKAFFTSQRKPEMAKVIDVSLQILEIVADNIGEIFATVMKVMAAMIINPNEFKLLKQQAGREPTEMENCERLVGKRLSVLEGMKKVNSTEEKPFFNFFEYVQKKVTSNPIHWMKHKDGIYKGERSFLVGVMFWEKVAVCSCSVENGPGHFIPFDGHGGGSGDGHGGGSGDGSGDGNHDWDPNRERDSNPDSWNDDDGGTDGKFDDRDRDMFGGDGDRGGGREPNRGRGRDRDRNNDGSFGDEGLGGWGGFGGSDGGFWNKGGEGKKDGSGGKGGNEVDDENSDEISRKMLIEQIQTVFVNKDQSFILNGTSKEVLKKMVKEVSSSSGAQTPNNLNALSNEELIKILSDIFSRPTTDLYSALRKISIDQLEDFLKGFVEVASKREIIRSLDQFISNYSKELNGILLETLTKIIQEFYKSAGKPLPNNVNRLSHEQAIKIIYDFFEDSIENLQTALSQIEYDRLENILQDFLTGFAKNQHIDQLQIFIRNFSQELSMSKNELKSILEEFLKSSGEPIPANLNQLSNSELLQKISLFLAKARETLLRALSKIPLTKLQEHFEKFVSGLTKYQITLNLHEYFTNFSKHLNGISEQKLREFIENVYKSAGEKIPQDLQQQAKDKLLQLISTFFGQPVEKVQSALNDFSLDKLKETIDTIHSNELKNSDIENLKEVLNNTDQIQNTEISKESLKKIVEEIYKSAGLPKPQNTDQLSKEQLHKQIRDFFKDNIDQLRNKLDEIPYERVQEILQTLTSSKDSSIEKLKDIFTNSQFKNVRDSLSPKVLEEIITELYKSARKSLPSDLSKLSIDAFQKTLYDFFNVSTTQLKTYLDKISMSSLSNMVNKIIENINITPNVFDDDDKKEFENVLQDFIADTGIKFPSNANGVEMLTTIFNTNFDNTEANNLITVLKDFFSKNGVPWPSEFQGLTSNEIISVLKGIFEATEPQISNSLNALKELKDKGFPIPDNLESLTPDQLTEMKDKMNSMAPNGIQGLLNEINIDNINTLLNLDSTNEIYAGALLPNDGSLSGSGQSSSNVNIGANEGLSTQSLFGALFSENGPKATEGVGLPSLGNGLSSPGTMQFPGNIPSLGKLPFGDISSLGANLPSLGKVPSLGSVPSLGKVPTLGNGLPSAQGALPSLGLPSPGQSEIKFPADFTGIIPNFGRTQSLKRGNEVKILADEDNTSIVRLSGKYMENNGTHLIVTGAVVVEMTGFIGRHREIGAVCSDNWGKNESMVACRQFAKTDPNLTKLKLSDADPVHGDPAREDIFKKIQISNIVAGIKLGGVICPSDGLDIIKDCQHEEWDKYNCKSYERSTVRCVFEMTPLAGGSSRPKRR